jgi:hypothetical protein
MQILNSPNVVTHNRTQTYSLTKAAHSSQVLPYTTIVSRDSAVGIAPDYGLHDCGVGVRVKIFHFSMSSRSALGSTQPPIQWIPGALSLGVKRPGREAYHSLRASATVKKM